MCQTRILRNAMSHLLCAFTLKTQCLSMTHILAKSIWSFMRYCLFCIFANFSNGRGSHLGWSICEKKIVIALVRTDETQYWSEFIQWFLGTAISCFGYF